MSDMPKEVKRVIPGCQHDLSRMIEWCTNGACPICLTADAGTKKDEILRLWKELEKAKNEIKFQSDGWGEAIEVSNGFFARLCEAERQLAGVVETLKQLLSIQGETIPVMNDEYVRLSWVRDIAEQALASLTKERSP